MFANFRVSARLIGGFLVVALIALCVALVGYIQINRVSKIFLQDALAGASAKFDVAHFVSDTFHFNDIVTEYVLNAQRPDAKEALGKEYAEERADLLDDIRLLAQSMPEADERERVGKMAGDLAVVLEKADKMIAAADRDRILFGPSVQEAMSEFDQVKDGFDSKTAALQEDIAGDVSRSKKQAERVVAVAKALQAALAAGAFIVALLLGWWASRSVTGPIAYLVRVSKEITAGDLGAKAQLDKKDELGDLAQAINTMTDNLSKTIDSEKQANVYLESVIGDYMSFIENVAAGNLAVKLNVNGGDDQLARLGRNLNQMVESLRGIAGNVKEATADITSSAGEISAASTQHNSSATEQAASIQQTNATVDEVRQISEQTAERARQVADIAKESAQISEAGREAVAHTIDGMNEIKEKVETIAENILALSEQTQQISDIISTVNDIAEQSNLLALNASIEAARAGEQGKGFAVVAQEVRNLAEQSQQATAQVSAILSDIQKATNAVVMVTEEGTKGVDQGSELARKAGSTIAKLTESIEKALVAAQQIAASAEQQTGGMDQIAAAMELIHQATSQNLSGTQQTERAAQNLSELGSRLKELVAVYRVD